MTEPNPQLEKLKKLHKYAKDTHSMTELNIHLEMLRITQAELLATIETGYDEKAIRELNVVNNNIQVTENRIKRTYTTRQSVEPLKIVRERR